MSDELNTSKKSSELICEPFDTESDKSKKNIIQEGLAEILITPNKNVFYNPVQEYNRDLSIFVLNTYSNLFYESKNKQDIFKSLTFGKKDEDGLNVLEALSATGLRSIRYAKETKGINKIVANDISSIAYTNIQKNIEHNDINELVTAHNQDATQLMHLNKHNFHVVDLDPYGCPTQFLDSAVQCASDGGLLMITCTDMAVLAGNTPETCRTKYGAISLKHRACHEAALRIALQTIDSHANRYGRYIKPLLSISADFYIRLFLTIHTSAKECKESASKLAYVHYCVGCETTSLQPLVDTIQSKSGFIKYIPSKGSPVGPKCNFCDSRHQMAGPIWAKAIHDKTFVKKIYDSLNSEHVYPYKTFRRIQGTLEMILEELDVPLYYTLPKLCSILHCTSPSLLQVRSAILHLGYAVSLSHCCPTSIKTNAPPDVIWAIMQAWTKLNPPSSKRLIGQAKIILEKTFDYQINFDIHPDANPSSRKIGLTRFQQNPPYWGPGTRHKTGVQENEKSRKKQGKKRENSPSNLNPSKKPAHSSSEKLI